jgi:hypothetical protein
MKIKITTKQIALITIFAALYAALRLLPAMPMIGVDGYFSLSDIVAPVYGILLGPYIGGASVMVGTFSAIAMGRPVRFLFMDFLPALVNAMALGFLMRGKWWPVVTLNAALLIGFIVNPLTTIFITIGEISIPFFWLHIVAFAVLISPLGRRAGQWIQTLKITKLSAGLTILAFVGTMMQHLMGNILTEVVRGQILDIMSPEAFVGMWNIIFFTYPWERLVLVIFAVIVGIPLIKVLFKTSFFGLNSQLLRKQKQSNTGQSSNKGLS